MRRILLGLGPLWAACSEPATAVPFACADSLARADGSQNVGGTCTTGQEYCYEATGGPAISHGAACRTLPKPDATCEDLVGEPGSSCTGTPETGLRVQFAFP